MKVACVQRRATAVAVHVQSMSSLRERTKEQEEYTEQAYPSHCVIATAME